METLADGGVFGGEWGAGKRRHISWRGWENGVFRFIRILPLGAVGAGCCFAILKMGARRSPGRGEVLRGAGWHLESHAGGRDLLRAFQFLSSVGPGGPRPLANGGGAAADALRKATADLRLQLFKNRLALAAAFPNHPEKAKLYCPQNLLEGPAPEK